MTTVRTLCDALSSILQVRGVERHPARLVRCGHLRAGGVVDERDAAILLLAIAAAPHPDQATEVVESLSLLGLRFLSQSAVFGAFTFGCGDDDRALMPGNVVDAVADALEYEAFNCKPGFQISRLSIQQGGQNAVLDTHVWLPGDVRDYCAQYGDINHFSSGLVINTVVSGTILRAVAAILHPSEVQQRQQEFMPSLAIN